MNYAKCFNDWLVAIKPELKGSSFCRYQRFAESQIMPELGGYDLEELNSRVIQGFIVRKSEECSVSSAKGMLSLIRRSLLYAEEEGMAIGANPERIRFKPRKRDEEEKKKRCLTKAEQQRLEEYILKEAPRKMFGVIICLYTGLRAGELLALEWTDIDFEHGLLSVNKSCRDGYGEDGSKRIVDTPKTRSSRRTIPLPRALLKALRRMRKESKGKYVIETKNGEPVSMRSYLYSFSKILERLNIPHMGLHGLRHTFATRAIECKMDVKTISEIMGHSSVSVTLNIYAHSLEEHKAMMMNKLGKMLDLHSTENFYELQYPRKKQ